MNRPPSSLDSQPPRGLACAVAAMLAMSGGVAGVAGIAGVAGVALLMPPPAGATVTLTVERPLDGDILVSPIDVRAEAATDASGARITGWQVFADGVTAYGTAGASASMAARINLDDGAHEIVVTAQDSTGDSATATLEVVIGVCSGFRVTLDAPGGGSETSPVHFAASAASCHRIIGFALYADDREIYAQRGARSVETTLELPAGYHTIFARAWDSTGAYANSSAVPIDVTVPPPPKPPARKPQTPPNGQPAPAQPPP